MTDEWGPPELCSPGLQIKATPTSRQSINQFPPQAPDQPINQSASQQMLLCLRGGAGSGMVELVTQTQTERSQVSGRKMILCMNQGVFAHLPRHLELVISVLG